MNHDCGLKARQGRPADALPSSHAKYIISRSVTPTTHARALLIRAITLLIYLTNAISPYAFTYSQLLLLWRPRAPGVMLHDSREIRLACVTGGGGVRSRNPTPQVQWLGTVVVPNNPGRTGGGVVSGEGSFICCWCAASSCADQTHYKILVASHDSGLGGDQTT